MNARKKKLFNEAKKANFDKKKQCGKDLPATIMQGFIP